MRVGIVKYLHREPLDALASGIRALGDTAIVQHHNETWEEAEYGGDYDAIMGWGMSPEIRRVIDIYKRRGVPCIVSEQGHIERGKYYQLGVDRVNWVPGKARPDRFEKLVDLKPWNPKPDGYVLLCTQLPGDSQHNISDMGVWRRETLNRLRSLTDRPIVLRKHPLDKTGGDYSGFDNYASNPDCTFQQALHGAYCVVTHNSNAGIQALIQGKPVLCAPGCWYGDVGGDWDNIEGLVEPDRVGFLSRVCYGQWTPLEMESGEAWAYLKPYIMEAANV